MSKQSNSKTYKLLSFLKYHTDADHPATQAGLREMAGTDYAKEIFGDKSTFSRRIRELADALNTDSNGELLPKDRWKLVFPGYRSETTAKNGKIYYQHPVSDFELEFLLQQVDASLDFTSDEKTSLKNRLTEALSSKYFSQNSFASHAIIKDSSTLTDYDPSCVTEKLPAIRQHILDKHMLELKVRDKDKTRCIRFSPYRVLKRDHRLWLIGNWHDRPQKEHPWSTYTDALTAIDINEIESLTTAHTPDKVYIHWTMTQHLLPGQSYTRESYANRITKARFPAQIQKELKQFDLSHRYISLEHMQDIHF